MRILWKALVGYGFVFWLLLCITDFLGITNVHKYSKDLDELYEKPVVVTKIEKQLEPHLGKWEYQGIKFGWSLLVWNTVTFIFSIVVCTVGQTAAWMVWGVYKCYRNKMVFSKLSVAQSQYNKSVTTLSRIPIMVKSITRSSDSNLHNVGTKSRIVTEKSCPNLFMRSGSNLSSLTDITTKTTRTLFKKDLYLRDDQDLSSEQRLVKQCKRLKEELHRLQTTSLKEHAVLSRKLESVNIERRELSTRLSTTQKENRAAKQHLEELFQEKAALVKKLDNATKEFKSNTKSKKFALAKLEEVTNNVEELRQQLEQVTRDKEILDKKLRLLEIEYNKLHERYINSQQRFFRTDSNDHLPERDDNHDKTKKFSVESHEISTTLQQTAGVLASVSQTELDMKKIQEKIKKLEKNLENLNLSNHDFDHSASMEQLESDLSLSGIDHSITDSQVRIEDGSGTNLSGFSSSNSPRQRYWSEKVGELIGKNKHKFAKIQALAMQMQEKARFLGNIRERTESTDGIHDLESTDSDERAPKRMVSSSVAFKNFLKSLNKLDAAKQHLSSSTEVYF